MHRQYSTSFQNRSNCEENSKMKGEDTGKEEGGGGTRDLQKVLAPRKG